MNQQNAPYVFVIVKPRLNPRWTARIVDAGIPLNQRTADRNREIAERHAAEAQSHGRDGWRGNRTDTVGQRQADSGVPVFGWEGTQEKAITLGAIRSDLVSAGYVLVSANLVQKEGDKMSFLYLRFEPRDTATPAVMSSEASNLIDEVLRSTWHHMHVFQNPNGSATVNPSHMLPPEELAAAVTERHVMRMSKDGSFRNLRIQSPAQPQAPAAPASRPPAPSAPAQPQPRDPNRGSGRSRW